MGAPKVGIYKVASKIKPERMYIGSSDNIHRRINMHKSQLKNKNHHSIILQNHVNKYGIKDLIFSIVEECDINELIKREQFYIDILNPFFNIRKFADSNRGIKRSKETKEKIRKANLGKKMSSRFIELSRIRMKGNSYTSGMTPKNAKKIICSENGFVFDSIISAADCFNINPKTLNAMLSGQNPNKTSLIYL